MRRIALCIEYDGTNYFGWQSQDNVPSIQAEVEKALSFVADHQVLVVCAGRTDARVHATGQIIHFDTEAERPNQAWVFGVNGELPHDIKVLWAREVPETFHARYSATARTYRYLIHNSRVASALLYHRAAWCTRPLDENLMHEAAQYLLGENDFTSFRGSGCQSKTPFRFMEKITVEREEQMVIVTVKANAFLLHMVRNIVGLLMDIGAGKYPPIHALEVLNARDRKVSSPTAQPQGLYLQRVHINPVIFQEQIEIF